MSIMLFFETFGLKKSAINAGSYTIMSYVYPPAS